MASAAGNDPDVTQPRQIPHELAPGIFLWRAVHPEWNSTTEFVGSYVLDAPDGIAIVDPMLAAGSEGEATLDWIVERCEGRDAAVFVTIPYHVRSSEQMAAALGGPIVGHPSLARRLANPQLLLDASTESPLPCGARAFRIGK